MNLPKSSKTLLKTPVYLKTKKLSTGDYYHFSLEIMLHHFLVLIEITEYTITLSINIDGLSLFHSIIYNNPFIISLLQIT